ncbi:lantibiotic dehydratase family protein [Streptomyces netropsis]|uniref:lantibiotic dehydratase family protein n=1 Tax=Streptomyces netropsis TaxID=55404 RepID=UPI0037B78757
MLRVTSIPPADLPRTLDLDDFATTRDWLASVWRHEDVRGALRVASPALYRILETTVGGARSQPRQVRQAALAVASYLLRRQHRPTLFGPFAGTAPVSVGWKPGVRWGAKHRVLARADAEWVTDIIQRLQQSPALLERLPLVANNVALVRGDRLVGPAPPAGGNALLMASGEVSVRHTRPVEAAMRAAREPVRYGSLRDRLHRTFPKAAEAQIDALLGDLIAQNLLITSLWGSMTTIDALGHVCAELEKIGAHSLDAIGKLVRALYAIHADLTGHDPSLSIPVPSDLTARMLTQSCVTPEPLLLDTVLDCDVQVPKSVVAEAQAAVAVLHRITPYPYGFRQWRDYHHRFRSHYGVGAVVPLLDLVADSKLGLPNQYLGTERGRAPRTLTDRDDALLALVQQALKGGHDELVLSDAVIADLAAGVEDPMFVQRVEVAFEVHAASTEALADGKFQLMLTDVPKAGSSIAGRFLHLMPPYWQEAWARTYRTGGPETITAQLTFVPRRRHNENVVRVMRLLPHVIGLSEHRAEGGGVIPLADLAVIANARGFHLVQFSSGRAIDVWVLHALDAAVQAPPLARLLAEIATSRCSVYGPFSFGAAAHLSYLPRVRYRRTILAPARWLLKAEDLPGRAASPADWEQAFAAWRAELRVPDRIAMDEIEQRLPLDLTHPVHRRLLRSCLHDTRRLELRERADPDDYAWIGQPHEILLPLIRAQ